MPPLRLALGITAVTGLAAWPLACDFADPLPPNSSTFNKSNGPAVGWVEAGGERVVNARVLLGSAPSYVDMFDGGERPGIVTTNGQGNFDFTAYRRPPDAYDITAIDESTGRPVLSHFTGVTRWWGQYLLFDDRPRTGWSARVHVVVDGLPPDAPNAKLAFFASGTPLAKMETSERDLVLVWKGKYATKLDLHALAYVEDPESRLPSRYVGHSTGSVFVSHGGSVEWRTSIAPVETTETTISIPDWNEAGVTFHDLSASVRVDAGEKASSFEIARPRFGTSRVVVPHFLNARFVLSAAVSSEAGRHLHAHAFGFLPHESKQEVTFERGRTLLDPLPPRVTPKTVFRWERGGTVRLTLDAGGGGRFSVISDSGQTALPESALSLLGVPLPAPDAPGSLTMVHYPKLATVDDLVQPFSDMDFVDRVESPPMPITLGR